MNLQAEDIRHRLRLTLPAGVAIRGRTRAIALASGFAFDRHPLSTDSVA
jgi:hypothetical protein